MKTVKRNIKSIHTARRIYKLWVGQCFCETPKAYEIWDIQPPPERLIKRIDKKRVLWIEEF